MMQAELRKSDAVPGDHRARFIVAEWFQLTYKWLRIAPDGDNIAEFDTERDVWVTPDDEVWSDVILSMVEVTDSAFFQIDHECTEAYNAAGYPRLTDPGAEDDDPDTEDYENPVVGEAVGFARGLSRAVEIIKAQEPAEILSLHDLMTRLRAHPDFAFGTYFCWDDFENGKPEGWTESSTKRAEEAMVAAGFEAIEALGFDPSDDDEDDEEDDDDVP
jgi:hypothetical protein